MYMYWSRLTQSSEAANSADLTRAKPLSDLYPPWLAARELLLHHRDPYGVDVTREIQVAYFGRELDASHAADLSKGQRFSLAYRFAYPLYAVLFVAPTIGMEFQAARAVAWWFLLSATILSAYLWLRFAGLPLSADAVIAIVALFLTSIPVMQGLTILQLGLVVAALIAAAAFSAARGQLFVAGVCLALATIRPQMSALAIGWFALWLSAGWRERRSLMWGFAVTLAALLLVSECILPGWLARYPRVLETYADYSGATFLLEAQFPVFWRWLFTILVIGFAAHYLWRARSRSAGSKEFALALAFVLTLTVLIVPTVVASFNHVLLLPAIVLSVRHWKDFGQGRILTRFAAVTLCVVALLPWLMAVVIQLGLVLGHGLPAEIWLAPLNTSVALPFAAFASLILLRHRLAGNLA
jgi:hypothetical protein